LAVWTRTGTITVPNTGTPPVARAVTGMPGQPAFVIFWSAGVSTFDTTNTHIRDTVGAARSSTEQFTIAWGSDGAGAAAGNTGRFARYGTECIGITSNGTPTVDALATFVSRDATGFTVNFTDVASVASTEVGYWAVGGADITNCAFQNVTPNTTTNGVTQTITFGFAPDCVLFFSPAVPHATAIVDGNTCLGMATRVSAQQYTSFWFENDGSANMSCATYSTNQRCHSQPAATAAKDADASLTTWGATGVTITWNDAVAATTARVYAIGIQGGQWEIEEILAPTSTGTIQYATTNTPKGIFAFGTDDPTDTDTTVNTAAGDTNFFVGACDTDLAQGNVNYIQTNGNATSVCQRRQSKTRFTGWMTGTAGTLAARGSVTAFGNTSFDVNWDTASAGTRRLAALVVGETPAAPPEIPNVVMAPMR
jgi:hypothetical protein